jgi:hypothetical protein
LGWASGMAHDRWTAFELGFKHAVYPLRLGGFTIHGYAALWALPRRQFARRGGLNAVLPALDLPRRFDERRRLPSRRGRHDVNAVKATSAERLRICESATAQGRLPPSRSRLPPSNSRGVPLPASNSRPGGVPLPASNSRPGGSPPSNLNPNPPSRPPRRPASISSSAPDDDAPLAPRSAPLAVPGSPDAPIVDSPDAPIDSPLDSEMAPLEAVDPEDVSSPLLCPGSPDPPVSSVDELPPHAAKRTMDRLIAVCFIMAPIGQPPNPRAADPFSLLSGVGTVTPKRPGTNRRASKSPLGTRPDVLLRPTLAVKAANEPRIHRIARVMWRSEA